MYSPKGHVLTRNPAYLERDGDRLRLYCIPDDGKSTLLIYEATPGG